MVVPSSHVNYLHAQAHCNGVRTAFCSKIKWNSESSKAICSLCTWLASLCLDVHRTRSTRILHFSIERWMKKKMATLRVNHVIVNDVNCNQFTIQEIELPCDCCRKLHCRSKLNDGRGLWKKKNFIVSFVVNVLVSPIFLLVCLRVISIWNSVKAH